MNRNLEDKLIKLAYGELSSREASAIEALVQTDPEAARLLASYRSLKTDMAEMPSPPPDQYSKERLRDAILGQGLKPVPTPRPSFGFGWLWMPATAFALAFGFMVVKRMEAPTPDHSPAGVVAFRAGEGSVADSTLRFSGFAKSPVSDFHPAPVSPLNAASTESSMKLASHHGKSHSRHLKLSDATLVDPIIQGQANKLVAMTALGAGSSVKEPDPAMQDASYTTTSNGANSNSADGQSSPIVMIDPEKDNDTGAQKATEVDSASNVIVGG
jgi:hypothetical protein